MAAFFYLRYNRIVFPSDNIVKNIPLKGLSALRNPGLRLPLPYFLFRKQQVLILNLIIHLPQCDAGVFDLSLELLVLDLIKAQRPVCALPQAVCSQQVLLLVHAGCELVGPRQRLH